MGFTPLSEAGDGQPRGFTPIEAQPKSGFIPLADADQPAASPATSGVLRTLLLNNPLTAIGEVGLNLGTMAVAQPVAGLAGLATEAGRLVGLTDRTGADVVHAVGDALTYTPRGEMGQQGAEIVAWPFQKLAEGAQWAGGKTLEATGSPMAATAVNTFIEGVLPLAAGSAAPRAIRSTPAAARSAGPQLADVPYADYVAHRRRLESGGDAQARNSRSSATGADQFIDRTWLDVVEQARPDWAVGLTPEQVLAERTNPARSAEMATFLDRQNAELLEGAGVEVNRHTLYAAHHFGPGKAIRLERASPDTPMSRILSPAQMRANPYLAGRTKAQALAEWDARAVAAGRRGFVPLDEIEGVASSDLQARAQRVARDEGALPEPQKQELEALRGGGDIDLRSVAGELPEFPAGHGAGANAAALAGAAERAGQLRTGQLRLDDGMGAAEPPRLLHAADDFGPYPDGGAGGAPARAADPGRGAVPGEGGRAAGEPAGGAAGQALDLADPRRADATPAGMGAADRHAALDALAPDEAGRTGGAHPAPRPAGPQADRGARYALIEADDLRASHDTSLRATPDYPQAFQRADWTRADAEQRVQRIVRDFDGERLTAALDDAQGAPIVSRGGVVEAGSARAIALQRVYEAEGLKAQRYRQQLADQAPAFGLDPAAVQGMRKPVLVRIPDEPTPRTRASELPSDGVVHARLAGPGGNYVGFIDDSAPGGPPPRSATASGASGKAVQPLHREDVLIDFARDMGTSIYEGRVRGKAVQGTFQPRTETVRIRRHADLETTAHEVAHLLDSRVPEIRQSWRSGPDAKAFAGELRELSYDRSKVYEGFAEFVRHYMTQPDVAAAKAPKFSAWFDDFVRRDPHGPAILKARQGMQDWYAQDSLQRARSKIGAHRPISDAMNTRWDAFRQSAADDLHGIYRMERELGGGQIAKAGPYESARLARASFSIADGAIRYGYPVKHADGSVSWKGKGLEEILRPVSRDLDDALTYFVGRSARELMEQGREHLFTKGEIDAMVALRRPEFDKAFTEYQRWNSGILDFAEAHGVIDPKARAAWKRVQYLPFHRVGQPMQGKARPGDWSGVKALTGGTENLRDILGNMTSNAAMLIDKAVKNEARVKIANLAEQNFGGRFMTPIPKDARPVKLGKDAVLDAVEKAMGLDKSDPKAGATIRKMRRLMEDAPELLNVMQTNLQPGGGNVVAVLRDGRPVWYEVADPILLRALESIDRKPMPWITKWLGLPKRIGQLTITMTPDFMMANIARDTIQGAVMSRAGFRPIIDSLNGMRLRLTDDPIYREFVANGGGMSSLFLDEGHFRAKLQRFYTRQGINLRTVIDTPAKLMGMVETLADAFETATRLGEYQRAVKAGENPRHAAYLAREVSTDFAMRGDSQALAFMQDVVMFLRPAITSWDRLYRGLAHDPNRAAIATRTGVLALMSSALYLYNKGNPRYQDLPDWDRDAHWHFFVGDHHFRFPKIWEIGAVSSAAERATEKIVNGDPQGLGKDFARITGATFNLNLMPQILGPLYEQATNRNSFTGASIETPGMENLQPFLRAKPTTSETLRALGMATAKLPEWAQVNPARTEALLRGYFNTWAMYGLMLSDEAFFGDQLPAKRWDEMPVVRRFYSGGPERRTRHEEEFYDLLGEAKRLGGTLRELDRQGHPGLADSKERDPMSGERLPLERAAKSLRGINNDMRQVRRDPALTPREKRERLDALIVERSALLKQAVTESRQATKEKTP